MTDNTPSRKAASLRAVGTSGVVVYGGVIYSDEKDRAWRGSQRDRTIANMMTDPLIGSVLYAIEMMIRRVDWRVKPSDDQNATAVELADFVQSCLDDMEGMWPGDTMADLLTYLAWGYAVAEVVYKQRVGPDQTDPSRKSRFTDGLIGWRKWMLLPQTTREGWTFANGDVVAFKQRQPEGAPLDVPLEKCVHLKYQSGSGSPEGRTPLRHAYKAWYYKENLQRVEAIGAERDLAGIPVMKIPAEDIENNTDTYVSAMNIVTSIHNDAMAGVVISSDVDPESKVPMQTLELLSSGGTRQFDTDVIIRRYANEVASSFFANVLRSGNDSQGSFALSQTLSDMFMTGMGAHLDMIQTAINDQVLPELWKVNGFDFELMPTIEHGDVENTDISRIGAYIAQLANAGLIEDTPALRMFVHQIANLPVGSIEEVTEQMDAQKVAEQAAKAADLEMQRANLEAARAVQNGKAAAGA